MKEKKKWSERTPQEKKKARLNLTILAVIGLIVVSVLIAGAFSDSPESQEKKEPVAVVHNDVLDASVRQVKQFLKKNLNDPESYDGVEWSPVSQNPHTKWFIARHKYRANNQYGATQIYTKSLHLTAWAQL